MTSAETIYELLPLGFHNRAHKSDIMAKAGMDDLEFRCACTILIEKGQALIFHDDCGKYYIPSTEDEVKEFGMRHPQDLKFQLACYNRSKFGFHQRQVCE